MSDAQAPSTAQSPSQDAQPTIVLVHGAFADASGWTDVIHKLQDRGYTAYGPANPLRGLSSDAAYIRSFLETITGPIVLVGHSYGGAVITNAATDNPNVTGLVYINGFALDQGESVLQALALGGAQATLGDHVLPRPFPNAGEGNADAYINPDAFHELFCADLSAMDASVMAATQRPAALATLGEPSGAPAWETIPSWYLASTKDLTIPVEAERFMAERARSAFVEIDSSHVAMMSHPDDVVDLILEATGVSSKRSAMSHS